MTEIPLGTTGPSRQGFGVSIVLFAGVFIGLLPNAAKIAYQKGANPLAVLTIRSVLGMIGLGIYMAAIGGRFKVGWPAFGFNAVTGAAHALAALAVKLDALDPRGIALALTGAVAATVMGLIIVGATKQVGAVTANFYMTVWASLYFILVAIFGPASGLIDSMAFPVSLKGWIGILGTGVTFTLGYTLFFVGAAIIGATRAAMISIVEPVLTILFAIMLVHEWLTAIQWLGVALVVASLHVMEMPRKVR